MRVLSILALVAVFLAVSVEARVVSRLQRAMTETSVRLGDNTLSYGFACKPDNSIGTCQKNLACEADSGTPPQQKTGFICLFPGEGDVKVAANAAPAVIAAAVDVIVKAEAATKSQCTSLGKATVKTMGMCACEENCTPGFQCVVPQKGGATVCKPPANPPAGAALPVPGSESSAACSHATPCAVGACMTKAAYLCRLNPKDSQSCNHVYNAADKLTCRVVLPLSPEPVPAATCSKKGEYTFWMGPTAPSNVDADAKGTFKLAGKSTPFLPCCSGEVIPVPTTELGQYGVVVGKLGLCTK